MISKIKPILLFMVILLAGCAAGSPLEPVPDATGMVLTPAPSPTPRVLDFTLKDLNGADVSLADLRGQVVLVNFWATWCTPCREEMPILEAYYQAHQEDGFVVVAVNVGEDAEVAAAYVQERGYTFPVWSDAPGKQVMSLGIRGLPASLFLDRAGRLQQFWSGPVDQEVLDRLVLPLLDE